MSYVIIPRSISLQQLSMFAAHLLFQMPLEDEQSKELTHCLQAFSFLKAEGVAGSGFEKSIARSAWNVWKKLKIQANIQKYSEICIVIILECQSGQTQVESS